MALTDSFRNNMYLLIDGKVFHVLERRYKTQGRGGGLIILKMKNLSQGTMVTKTVNEGTKFEEISPEMVKVQYLYQDGDSYIFMNSSTFENIAVGQDVVSDNTAFLKEGAEYWLMMWDGKVVNVKFPPKVSLLVTDASDAVKGDTASAATKVVTTETGLKVTVPLFVKQGDTISINTETKEYTGRVKA